ncbi:MULTISPECIES: peptidoglycan-binding protein [Nostocales]|jgi:peptidoglycan hydrolase-like protein with peptidoglycan-binding domain|uniref:Cell wall-binding protein n=1 Tax=Dolichospermum flos-aquae UHCC 0037 TaxID=2590026 RepID=A0ACC7S6A5_DOLFA|nr:MULTISPECIES: peptidoglycan-binding protein [Nostocales]MBO1064492.1 cell wall-binding protein [Anabaena sp. 54]MTJ43339.1 cell wall-binding protein [Dolichospermum flos-aquae UHCC 0037]
MENLAYLHLAFANQDEETTELISLSSLFKTTAAPNWQLFSSSAWKYMIPLALTISILNSVSSVFALEKNDNAATVNSLQQNEISQIKTANNRVISTAPITPTISNNIISVNKKRKDPNLLSKGDEGADVKVLQERLKIAGFYYGNSTGIFGPITHEAVKRFQKAYQLTVDGVVGKSTLAKLPDVTDENQTTTSQKLDHPDILSLGDRGEAVRILQAQLITAGFLQNQPNGYYGSNTVDAVKRFQKQHKLEINGLAGQTTRSKLHSLVKNSAKSDFTTLEIQRRLQEKGFYKGQINGMMASDTKKAISRAQEFYGISLKDIKSGSF